jgi:hypothetical protein
VVGVVFIKWPSCHSAYVGKQYRYECPAGRIYRSDWERERTDKLKKNSKQRKTEEDVRTDILSVILWKDLIWKENLKGKRIEEDCE